MCDPLRMVQRVLETFQATVQSSRDIVGNTQIKGGDLLGTFLKGTVSQVQSYLKVKAFKNPLY
jgi:hypothetical protein